MQKLARDRVRTTTPLGSGEEQRFTKELQEAMKSGAKAWDENFEKVYDLAWEVVQRNVAAMCPGGAFGERWPTCGLRHFGEASLWPLEALSLAGQVLRSLLNRPRELRALRARRMREN